jgi:glycosyltransferase involved in cell wall biosynthesis
VTNGKPKVSVLLPVFNGGEWLEPAIVSILGQSFPDLELIVIDDGSTDETGRIVENAKRNDGRIRSERLGHMGIATALNRGLAMARSEIIARMDADDLARPDRLQRQFAFLERNPNVAAVGSWARIVDRRGEATGALRPETESLALRRILEKQNPFVHSSMMLRADPVRRLGGYRPALEGAEDYDLWLRLSEHALLANVPEFLIDYRRHQTSASAAASHKQLLAARLARMSAEDRRASRADFVDEIKAPISLAALRSHEKLRTAADLYGLLARLASEPIGLRDLLVFWRMDLNHAERKAAQIRLKELLGRPTAWSIRILAFVTLLYLHPFRGLSLARESIQRGRSP